MNKHIAFLMVALAFQACLSSKNPNLTAEQLALVSKHSKIAVLPFKVNFSDSYKNSVQANKTKNTEDYWHEQQRVAGLDLQKEAFLTIQKLFEKEKFTVISQDILSTRKKLVELGIAFSEIESLDKGNLAKDLGVDAVIWGKNEVNLNSTTFNPNSNQISMEIALYNANTFEPIWKNSDIQRPNSRMDTPQSLGKNSVYQLIKNMPYRRK